MTNTRKMIAMVIALLLLTACQAMPDDIQSLASTPSSSGVTPPPSSSVVPTTRPAVPPTTQPTVIEDGRAFIYYGPQHVILAPYWRPEEALIDHLYWVVRATKECTLICDEPVAEYTITDTHILFVKKSEPTKVYTTPIGDFTNHQLFYESTYGIVSYMNVVSSLKGYLQFVADSKKFVILDMATGETTLLMEQYYIDHAYVEGAGDGMTWNNWLWFQGKTTENDPPDKQYFYNRNTGEIEIDNSL